jgi:hypothetical protein
MSERDTSINWVTLHVFESVYIEVINKNVFLSCTSEDIWHLSAMQLCLGIRQHAREYSWKNWKIMIGIGEGGVILDEI